LGMYLFLCKVLFSETLDPS